METCHPKIFDTTIDKSFIPMAETLFQPFFDIHGRFHIVSAQDRNVMTQAWAYKMASKLYNFDVSDITIFCPYVSPFLKHDSDKKLQVYDPFGLPLVVIPHIYGMEMLTALANIDKSLNATAKKYGRRKLPQTDGQQASCTFTLWYRSDETVDEATITVNNSISDKDLIATIKTNLDGVRYEHSFYLLCSTGKVLRNNFYNQISSEMRTNPDCVFFAYPLHKVYLNINDLLYPVFLSALTDDLLFLNILDRITPINRNQTYVFTLNDRPPKFIDFKGDDQFLLSDVKQINSDVIRIKISPLVIPPVPRFDPGYELHDDHANLITVKLVKELGRGGNGVVYKAIDLGTNQEIVVKCCVHSTAANFNKPTPESNSLTREHGFLTNNMLAKLEEDDMPVYEQSKFFLPLDTSEFKSKFGIAYLPDVHIKFITLSYISGGDLRSKLIHRNQGTGTVDYIPMSRPNAALLATQMIKALHLIHVCKNVHMDIKPHNIMFDNAKPGRAILIDYGNANRPVSLFGDKLEPFLGGTPSYSSHWINQGEPATYRDDLISLGYVLYFATIAVLPWQGKKADTEAAAHALFAKEKMKHMTLFTECEWEPLRKYFQYVMELPWQAPSAADYPYLISLFEPHAAAEYSFAE